MEPGSRYEIEERIGVGGFGAVYRARMHTPGGLSRRVALKMLKAELTDAQNLGRLRDEARLLSRVSHRAVVSVFDLVELSIGWAVVLELVDGLDLREICSQERLPPRTALEVVGEVASALHAAYTSDDGTGPLRLVHRDIKPANLILTEGGEIKLLDFGIAAADLPEREARTATSQVYGTYRYMAPERFYGVCGPESDIYSLGVVLAELTGLRTARPGDREGLLEMLPALAEQAGQDVADLVREMLGPTPADRPSAMEVARRTGSLMRALEGPTLQEWAMRVVPRLMAERTVGLEDDDPLVGTTLSTQRLGRRPTQKRPSLLLPVMLFGGIAGVGVALLVFLSSLVTGTALRAGVKPPSSWHVASLEELDTREKPGCPWVSADGLTVTYDAEGKAWRQLLPLGPPHELPVGEGIRCPVLSSDGSKVVVHHDGRVRTYAITGELLDELVLDALPVGWAEAGPVLMAQGLESSLYLVEDGIPRLFWRGSRVRDARWTGGGALLIVGSELVEVDAEGKETKLTISASAADALSDGTRLLADAGSTSSRILLQAPGERPSQQSQMRGSITSVAAARDVPRAVLEQRELHYVAQHVVLDPVRKRVVSSTDIPLANDVIGLGFLNADADWMAIKQEEVVTPGSRGVQERISLWSANQLGMPQKRLYEVDGEMFLPIGSSPDHALLYALQVVGPEKANLLAIDLLGESVNALMTIDPRVTGYAMVSPDGRRLAYADADGRVYTAPVGPPLDAITGEGLGTGLEIRSWVDDRRLLVVDGEQNASVVHVDEGRVEALGLQARTVLPAGHEDLLLVVHEDRLFWLDVATRTTWPILTLEGGLAGLDVSADGQQLAVTVSELHRRLWLAELERAP